MTTTTGDWIDSQPDKETPCQDTHRQKDMLGQQRGQPCHLCMLDGGGKRSCVNKAVHEYIGNKTSSER